MSRAGAEGPGGYRIEIDRVVVHGGDGRDGWAASLDAAELTSLVQAAVAERVAGTGLPSGRARHTAVTVDAGQPITDAPGVAAMVARGVTAALGGGSADG